MAKSVFNPFDLLRENVEGILEHNRSSSSEVMEFFAFVSEDRKFYCSNQAGDARGRRVEFVQFIRVPLFNRALVLGRIAEDEDDDTDNNRRNEEAGITDTDNWRNWDEPELR